MTIDRVPGTAASDGAERSGTGRYQRPNDERSIVGLQISGTRLSVPLRACDDATSCHVGGASLGVAPLRCACRAPPGWVKIRGSGTADVAKRPSTSINVRESTASRAANDFHRSRRRW